MCTAPAAPPTMLGGSSAEISSQCSFTSSTEILRCTVKSKIKIVHLVTLLLGSSRQYEYVGDLVVDSLLNCYKTVSVFLNGIRIARRNLSSTPSSSQQPCLDLFGDRFLRASAKEDHPPPKNGSGQDAKYMRGSQQCHCQNLSVHTACGWRTMPSGATL